MIIRKFFKRVLIMLVLISLVFSGYTIGNIIKNQQSKTQELKSSLVKEEELNTEFELQKAQYEEAVEKARMFKTKLIDEVKIIILQEQGKMSVNHSKYQSKREVSNFFFESTISMSMNYTASIGIDTKDISFVVEHYNGGKIQVRYSKQSIYVISVEIDKILCDSNQGVFAKKYEPSEVSALSIVAKEKIRKRIEEKLEENVFVRQQLDLYLENQARKLGIYNFEVIEV